MGDLVLTLNAGSSSLKLGVFSGTECLLRGTLDFSQSPMQWRSSNGGSCTVEGGEDGVLPALLALVGRDVALERIGAVAHRMVHGGAEFTDPVRVDDGVIKRLRQLAPLAPLHMPEELDMLQMARAALPKASHVACFDTAFHATQPRLSQLLPLPRSYFDQGVRRYGFHGLSYGYVAKAMRHHLPLERRHKVIVAHLGSGSSLCALKDGKSIASSMGFSALDGLMMATRPGRLDAGVLLYLLHQGQDVHRLETLLYKQSGLLGVSGLSGDMRQLLAADSPEAAEAVALYCQRAAQEIASLMVPLAGLEALIFTGGIGEHQPALRAAIVALLAPFGAKLDAAKNSQNQTDFTHPESTIGLYTIPTDEEAEMAQQTLTLLEQLS